MHIPIFCKRNSVCCRKLFGHSKTIGKNGSRLKNMLWCFKGTRQDNIRLTALKIPFGFICGLSFSILQGELDFHLQSFVWWMKSRRQFAHCMRKIYSENFPQEPIMFTCQLLVCSAIAPWKASESPLASPKLRLTGWEATGIWIESFVVHDFGSSSFIVRV